MKYPDLEILRFRDSFLASVRSFFRENGYLEVETPILNPTGAVEAFLDPFLAERTGPGKSGRGYLITSPEYNLKKIAASGVRIFEIAHCFRAGDSGGHHSEEFLMLEWYRPGSLDDLMAETTALLHFLGTRFRALALDLSPRQVEVEALFLKHTGRGFSERELLETALETGLGSKADRYDELFFSIFLNAIEPRIRTPYPLFLKDYPPELAALARIVNGKARRFELYWQGVEVCNAYDELPGRLANEARFEEANQLRSRTGRAPMEADPDFLSMVDRLDGASGNALGLERLMMIFSGCSFEEISPFAKRLPGR